MRFRLVTVVEKKFFGLKGTFVDDSPVAVTDAEIRRRARRDGVEPSVIELDWALGWALWALAASDHLRPRLLFKDGTCLRKCYCPGYRFSEDLDFTVTEWFGWDAFEASIREAFRAAGEASGIDFDAREPHVDLVDNEYGRETLNVRVYWRGPHLRRGRSASTSRETKRSCPIPPRGPFTTTTAMPRLALKTKCAAAAATITLWGFLVASALVMLVASPLVAHDPEDPSEADTAAALLDSASSPVGTWTPPSSSLQPDPIHNVRE